MRIRCLRGGPGQAPSSAPPSRRPCLCRPETGLTGRAVPLGRRMVPRRKPRASSRAFPRSARGQRARNCWRSPPRPCRETGEPSAGGWRLAVARGRRRRADSTLNRLRGRPARAPGSKKERSPACLAARPDRSLPAVARVRPRLPRLRATSPGSRGSERGLRAASRHLGKSPSLVPPSARGEQTQRKRQSSRLSNRQSPSL
mmetsp:Transcript_26847/g.63699  ORF Transcript_26847/g.63699 Transcript_26847/m.63699 type:complete len:201 (+) Transcript_26847:8261-8863(+)